jgi:hypothetical protein
MKTMTLTKECKICKTCYVISVDLDAYQAWRSGSGLIQDLLSNNTATEREILVSGTCGECFDKIFLSETEEHY